MANTKEYRIVINGIEESISQIEALRKKLESLEAQITEIEKKTISIKVELPTDQNINAVSSLSKNVSVNTTSSSKKDNSSLTEEVALQKEINKLKEEGVTLDAKIEAAQSEVYKKVQATKDLYKEVIADQKQVAAEERLIANEYSNTMAGIKQHLADLKTSINTTDLGDSDKIKKMTEEANELTKKLKEMEEAYGQFGRNVGNYDGIANGMSKVKVEVGAVTKEFNSAREAARTLQNQLTALETSGKRNTQEAKNLRTALYNLQSAMKDATVSSKAMDEAMDWMQSFAAIGSAGKGLQAFFGLDNNEITKSIQQLVALQSVLQGIESLRKQMETHEGIGKVLGKGFDKIDTWTFGLKRMIVEMKGVGTSARIAAAGVNVLKVAMKGLMSLGLLAVITLAIEGIQKIIEKVTDWAKGNADLVDSEKLLNASLEQVNTTYERRLALNNALYNAGYLSKVEKEIEDEKALAEAIKNTNEEIERRMNQDPKNKTFSKGYNANSQNKYYEEFMKDGGVTWGNGFGEMKTYDDLIARWKELTKAVKEGNGMWSKSQMNLEAVAMSADDVKDELNHLEQFIAGGMVKAFESFNLSTQDGRRQFADFVNSIMDGSDEMKKSVLLRLPEIVSDNEGKLGTALSKYLELIRQFALQANSAMQQFKFEEYVESILDAADETGKRHYEKQKQELKQRYDQLNDAQKAAEKKRYDEANAALDKMFKKRNEKLLNQSKKDKNQLTEVENELIRLRLEKMDEGLRKEIAHLKEEQRQKLQKAKETGIKVGELTLAINELYYKKIEEAKRKHAEEMKKIEDDIWRSILDKEAEYTEKHSEINEQNYQLNRSSQEKAYAEFFEKQNIGGYGIQGKNTFSPQTQQAIGFASTVKDNKLIDDTKKLIEAEREYQTVSNQLTFYEKNSLEELKRLNDEHAAKKEETLKKLEELERRREPISQEEYDSRKESLEKEYSITISTMEKMAQEREVLENKKSTMSKESYEKETQELEAKYKVSLEKYSEYLEKVKQLDQRRISISEEDLQKKKEALDEEYSFTISTMAKMAEEREVLENKKSTMSKESYEKENQDLQARYKVTLTQYGEYLEKVKQLNEEKVSISEQDYRREKYLLESDLDKREAYIRKYEDNTNRQIQLQKTTVEAKRELFEQQQQVIDKEYSNEEAYMVKQALLEENYSASLSQTFRERMSAIQVYWQDRVTYEYEMYEQMTKTDLKLADRRKRQALAGEDNSWNEQVKIQNDWAKKKKDGILQQQNEEIEAIKQNAEKKKLTQQELDAQLIEQQKKTDQLLNDVDSEHQKMAERLLAAHNTNMEAIEQQYETKVLSIKEDEIQKKKQLNQEYFSDSLTELTKFNSAVAQLESKQPVKNAWGFTNWSQTDANNKQLLSSYENMIKELNNKKRELNQQFNQGLIDKDVYNTTLNEMDALASGIGEKMDKVRQELSFGNKMGTFIQEAQQYINAIGNGLNQVLSAVWAAADSEYEYNIKMLEKSIEQQEEAYQKQQEMTREYADNVNSIEDELKTARGARRQQLIDNLNAQMAAQRASLAQEKKIEKDKERLQKKKEEEEKKQRQKEKERQVIQAIISTALATANGLATQPFVPVGIAMGALAASLGAVQIALIRSQKVYAHGGQLDGGVAVGRRHTDFGENSGIKVLGGRAEIEGGEFITNRITTSKNIDVLEYINSKKKRVNLDDMIEFYSGKASNVKKVVRGASPRTRFADGGVIPTLRSDFDFSDRLINSFEAYSNRPQVVQVVDIIDAQDNLNKVKVLSGLNG